MKIYRVSGNHGQSVSLWASSADAAKIAVRRSYEPENVVFGRGADLTAEEDTAQMEREQAYKERRAQGYRADLEAQRKHHAQIAELHAEREGKVLVPTQTLLDVLKYLDGVEICRDADWNAVMPLIIKIRKCLVGAVPK